MKTMLIAAASAALVAVTGCKTIPTVESVERTSAAIGMSAGMVADQMKMSEKTRSRIIEISDDVAMITPCKGQKFVEAWVPFAKEIVDRLSTEGKIDKAEGIVIVDVVEIAGIGLDYLFDIRYPDARDDEELVAAAIRGFVFGFKTSFENRSDGKSRSCPGYDRDALTCLVSVYYEKK